ncbi:MAG: low temperature requirement protein A [Rhodoglobus sp.]
MRRVHWMELFFDLVFVVFIGQLAHSVHGEPGGPQFGAFLFILAIGWWAWINVTITINILPGLPAKRLAIVMLLGMVSVGAMAVAAPEASGDRAWLFAIGGAALRLVLLPLWLFRAKRNDVPIWNPIVYNGATAALWLASAFVPQPAQFVVWVFAVGVEIALQNLSRRNSAPLVHEIEVPHLAERLGLFVIIVMGESVFSVIEALSTHWEPAGGPPAVLGMALISMLAWTYFLHNSTQLEEGLAARLGAGDTVALRDAAMFLPFVLVAGVTIVAASLATAIEHPDAALSLGNAIGLFAGLASFYLITALVAIRLKRATRRTVMWMLISTVLLGAGLAVSILASLPATLAVAIATGIVAILTAYRELAARSARAN